MARSQSDVLQKLGGKIRELRVAAGLTQEALCERVQMVTPNLARIEQGRQNVTVGTLLRLAEALDVELVDLFRDL